MTSKKEDKHNCPTNQKFSDKKGKCVTPDLETVNQKSSTNDIVPNPNLRFPHVTKISGTSEGMDSNIDVTVQQSNADKHQDKQQQKNTRAPNHIQDRQVSGLKTQPFRNFQAKHTKFTSNSTKPHHTADGANA